MAVRRFEPYRDEEFIRGDANGRPVPMTGFETRAVLMAKLGVRPDDVVLDIGSGTGSLTLEAARLAYRGEVFAVDRSKEAVEVLERNLIKHGVGNVTAFASDFRDAAAGLSSLKPDRIIIGGSGGDLAWIIDWCGGNLKDGGRVCGAFITLENAALAARRFRLVFGDVDIVELFSARGRQLRSGLSMMLGNNPAYILTAQKRGSSPDPCAD